MILAYLLIYIKLVFLINEFWMKKNIFFEDFRLSNFDDESDFFPLLSSVDEEKISREI